MERMTLSVAEAAEVLGISRKTAYDLISQGTFPVRVLQVGGVMKISRVLLDQYLATGNPQD